MAAAEGQHQEAAPVASSQLKCDGRQGHQDGHGSGELSATQTGVVAAQERQSALLCKGKYRKAEMVAREAPEILKKHTTTIYICRWAVQGGCCDL